MKRLALFLLSVSAFGACGGWTNGYGFCRTVTVDHTKVPNTDQTNFPVGIATTLSYLATVANGGLVQSGTGLDILFTSDTAGTTVLNFERVNYAATTGAVEFWVQIPTLSHTVDTVFYMYYGKAGVSDPSNTNATWNDGIYRQVVHFGSTSSLVLTDSTSNAINAALPGGTNNPTAGTGNFGGAASFASASSQFVTSNAAFTGGTFSPPSATIEVWIKTSTNQAQTFMDSRDIPSSSGTIMESFSPTNTIGNFCNPIGTFVSGATVYSDGNWHVIAVRQNGNTDTKTFLDGILQGTQAGTCGFQGATNNHWAANVNGAVTYNGLFDEVRISATANPTTTGVRTTDWMTTEANNLTQGTFYTIGSQALGTIPGQFPRVQ